MEEMFKEAKRVLLPKGIMIITEVLPSTIKEAIWYCQLSQTLCDRFSKLFPSMKQYLDMFDKYGFECASKLSVLGRDLQDSHYDPEGPLKREWRNGISVFAFATEQEIDEIEQIVRKMNDNGTITDYIKEHDRLYQMGFLTILVCVRL